MAKALKPLIVIQLLVSIAALVLGIILFKQREVLKKRTQTLEQAAGDVARAIHHDEFNVASLKNYQTMGTPLRQLVAMGQNRWQELQDTRQDLENTIQDLNQTRDDLAKTKSELSDANDQIAQLSDTLNQREAELAQANDRISSLETETADLHGQLDDLNTRFAETEENLNDCEANYESLKLDFDKLVGETTGGPAAKGLAGKVLLVNPEWNFVVLDIGSESGLAPAAEMLVHRSDHLIGRVRVSSVNESLAVAEILGDWKQKAIHKGDFVISPES